MKLTLRTLLSALISLSVCVQASESQDGDVQRSAQFRQASMTFDGQTLTVGTGLASRQWKVTPEGISTISLKSDSQEFCRMASDSELACDWNLCTKGNAKLVSLTAQQDNDERFTTDHLSVVAQFEYPEDNLAVRYVIWAYPEAPGLRTQLFVKGLAGEAPAREITDQLPRIEVLRGKSHTAKGSAEVAGEALASTVFDVKSIELHAKNLQPERSYLLGVSWWDWGGGGRTQRVRVSSVDRSNTRTVIAATRLPSWKGRQEDPYEFAVRVPESVLLDGSFRVFIDNVAGSNANVSEIWLYQSGKADLKPALSEKSKRITALTKDAPIGYRLVAYLDAGSELNDSQVNEQACNQVDALPLVDRWESRRAFGLLQGIKANGNARILKEQEIPSPQAGIDWANGVVFQAADRGVVLVKESNKHTALSKSDDVDTGGFRIGKKGVQVTGLGYRRFDLDADEFTSCWATWTIPYLGDEGNGNLALKQFDRFRYPINPDRDIYIMANTWGTEDKRPPCLHAAREANVLEELESVADLGIDVLQIDDGWQTSEWTPAKSAQQVQLGQGALEKFGNYEVYPSGWANVRKRAEELGVVLGLWAAWTAPTDALQINYDQGNFKYFKLDFANLNTKHRFDELQRKARDLIKHSNYSARVNWDVTETPPRMGYFAGREYGNVYLQNRKTLTVRDSVIYIPHKVLADAWNLARYVNLNKFQVPVQNVDNVRAGAPTDAALHSHEYAVGIALMSSPIFFQETRHYQQSARERIRRILSIYREHREAIYQGFVFPIGKEPNNKNWTGFQNYNPKTGKGYLTVFRERLNKSPLARIRLEFIQNVDLKLVNLLTGDSSVVEIGPNGMAEFEIPETPGFLFLRYESN